MRDGARLVATAALLPYSAGNAWISMVLVTADFRRRGIATKLVDACLDAATRRGLTTWLDATPAGAAVYGPLGFTPTLQLRRLRLEKPQGIRASRPLSAGNLDALAARDGSAMGFDRSTLLSEFSARPGSRIVSEDRAMALVRNGRTARHIGPLLADRADQALALVDAIVHSETGPWLIDAVHSQDEFLGGLVRVGLEHRAAVSAHALWPGSHFPRATAVRRRRPGIWIGSATMHHSEIKAEIRKLSPTAR